MRFVISLLFLTLLVSGCGKSAPRFDTSSQQAFEISAKKVEAFLTPDERKLMAEARQKWIFAGLDGQNPDSEKAAWESIKQKTEGKTGKQLIADYQTFLTDERRQKIKRVLENESKIETGFSEQQVIDLLGEPDDRQTLNGKETFYFMTADSKKNPVEHPVIGDVAVFIEDGKVTSSGKITKITTP